MTSSDIFNQTLSRLLNQARSYIITNTRIIAKVVKRLDKINSMRIQKSVFEVQCDEKEIATFLTDVLNLICKEIDRIALIPLCANDYERTEFYGVLSRQPELLPKYYLL